MSLEPSIMPSIDTHILERRRHFVQAELGAFARESVQFQEYEDVIFNRLVYRLTADVLAERLPPERIEESTVFTYDCPASPFQHWKQNHATSWWLRWYVARRPVRLDVFEQPVTLTVDLERYRTFPQCERVFPQELGPYVQVATVRKNWTIE